MHVSCVPIETFLRIENNEIEKLESTENGKRVDGAFENPKHPCIDISPSDFTCCGRVVAAKTNRRAENANFSFKYRSTDTHLYTSDRLAF